MYYDNYLMPNSGNDLIKVNGIEGAKAYPVRPNCRIALFDANENIFYIKSTDAGGYPSITAYSFQPMEAQPAPIDNRYVTIEDFNKFKEELLDGKFTIPTTTSKTNYKPTWSSIES